MEAVAEQKGFFGVKPTCLALDISPATYYRRQGPRTESRREGVHPRALSGEERQRVLSVLNGERFCDQAPAEVYASLLDQGEYLCSERTMYRILAENREVRERRNQLRHPHYAAPELLATRPNQVWSWDITKLLGPSKWTYYYLYVILDIYSRYVVGWMLAYGESAILAERLIGETFRRQGIEPGELVIHADRGPSMRSKTVALLMGELGVTKTHSRPYVSNDNPYSESQFKTMKYRPDFPDRFGSFQHARSFCCEFFPWYNHEHHHSGLGYLTAFEVHHGQARQRMGERALVLECAFEANPERFVRGVPKPPALPQEVWINKPKQSHTDDSREDLANDSGARGPIIEVHGSVVSGNGFQRSPISNDRESGKDLGRGQNRGSQDAVQ